jgi:hypothetical protein
VRPNVQAGENLSALLNSSTKSLVKQALGIEFSMLKRSVIEVENPRELRKLFGWKNETLIDEPKLSDDDYPEGLNLRRLHDAEVVASVMANLSGATALEISTAEGHMAVLMAQNAPESKVFTLNTSPGDLELGETGNLTTGEFSQDRVAEYYRELGCQNLEPIYANSAAWPCNIGPIGAAFIDGCHDAQFVYDQTVKALSIAEPGSFIMWHDFSVPLVRSYHWIYEVCVAIEELYRKKMLRGDIYHLRDSWVGLYRVPLAE